MRIKLIIISLIILIQGLATAQELTINRDWVQQFFHSNHTKMGLSLSDINPIKISSIHTSKHNGLTHVYLQQTFQGIELHNGLIQLHFDSKGKLFQSSNQFLPQLSTKAATFSKQITAPQAIDRALKSLKFNSRGKIYLVNKKSTPNQESVYSDSGTSLANIPAKLVYALDDSSQPHLAWDLQIQTAKSWWNIRVDAQSGEIMASDNWTSDASYAVIPQPFESPIANGASHQVVSNVADITASPFGWHDTNGIVGAEFTTTQGNNVNAQEDLDANNFGGFRPDGGVALDFDFALDENTQPNEGDNLAAGIVNLFYWNNVIHDIMYQYGFDEASGNFQVNNYGNGGSDSDPVNADAQDGSGNNNANFSSPPDGFSPRMQMFTFLATVNLTVDNPVSIAGSYTVGGAGFGASIDQTGINGLLELVNDNTETNSDACQPLVGFTAGKIALLDRGNCQFGVKVLNAEQAGAIAAVVINNQGNATMTMGPGTDGNLVSIPSVFIGQSNGNLLRNEAANAVSLSIKIDGKNRDGDLDNGIIIHEYGHGISNRLTGGAANAGCLQNIEQMGEGWSDFFFLALTSQSGDASTDARGTGSYAANNQFGIRQYPYSTDMNVNLHVFSDIDNVSLPHGLGTVWTAMLWEVYWNLIDKHGYDSDIYQGTGGNNIMLQLVIDGLKLQPCNPGFQQGRDGILAADMANNQGANQCEIWRGFAKRGLGVNASSGNSDALGDEVENFEVPQECIDLEVIYKNGFE